MSKPIDPQWLGERLRTVRQQRQLTLQDVSKQTNISVPTLSRIELGGSKTVRSDTLITLMGWLGTEADKIQTGRSLSEKDAKTTPDLVALHLRADKRLDAKTAVYLEEMFRTVYDKFANQSTKR